MKNWHDMSYKWNNGEITGVKILITNFPSMDFAQNKSSWGIMLRPHAYKVSSELGQHFKSYCADKSFSEFSYICVPVCVKLVIK